MRILVSGGTGFLGRHLVWRLLRNGHEVVYTGRSAAAAAVVAQQAVRPARFVAVEHGNELARRILQQCGALDAIVHCAALSAPWGSRAAFERANISSTAELLDTAASSGARRFVHISTPSLYFDYRDRLAIREDTPLPPPVNRYAASKAVAERLVQASPLPGRVILRPRALFGPWDNTLMPRLLRVMQRGRFPLPRAGRALLDITHVDNAVHAIQLALEQPLPQPCAIYNVSNGEPLTLLALLHRLQQVLQLQFRLQAVPYWLLDGLARVAELQARLSGCSEPALTRYSAGTLSFSQTLDLTAIRRDLGYAPLIDINSGLQQYGIWLREQPDAD